MPFRSGSITYRRFAVTGANPDVLDPKFFEALRESALGELEPIKPGEMHVGFTAGRHLFDRAFDYERVGFGSGVMLGYRVDTVRVPPEIKKAYIAMSEDARTQPSKDGAGAFLPRTAKKEARDDAMRRIEDEIGEGRYRRPKHAPIWWDFSKSTLYAALSNDVEIQALNRLMLDTLGVKIEPRSAGRVALDLIAAKGRTDDYDDLRAQPLSSAPPEIEIAREDGSRASADRPELPWTSNEPQDFLGNLFLLWLWWRSSEHRGEIETAGETVHVMIDRVLDMTCAWGVGGSQNLRGDGPAASAEARKALQAGKWPRRCGLVVVASGQQWMLTLQGESLSVSGLVIPQPEEPDEHERATIERRVDSMLTFDRTLVAMYRAFLEERLGRRWSATSHAMRDWIARAGAAPAAASRREAQVAEA